MIKNVILILLISVFTHSSLANDHFKKGTVLGCGSDEELDLPALRNAMGGTDVVIADHGDGVMLGSPYSYITISKSSKNSLAINPEIKLDGVVTKYYPSDDAIKAITGLQSTFASYINQGRPDKGILNENGIFEFDLDFNFRDQVYLIYKRYTVTPYENDKFYFYSNILGQDLIENIQDLKKACRYKLRMPNKSKDSSFYIDIVEQCEGMEEVSASIICNIK